MRRYFNNLTEWAEIESFYRKGVELTEVCFGCTHCNLEKGKCDILDLPAYQHTRLGGCHAKL